MVVSHISKGDSNSRAGERRNQIMDAATVAIARKGYYATTMDDIREESGLGKGSLYLYFKSKKEILLALCDRWINRLNGQMVENLANKTGLIEQMRALADTYVQVTRTDSYPRGHRGENIARLTAEFWQQAVIDPDVKARFIDSYAFWSPLVQRLVDEAIATGEFREIDSGTLVMVVTAVFDGLTWRWLLNPDEVHWEQAVNVLFEVMLNGLTPRGKQS